jgi:hypothetical protein
MTNHFEELEEKLRELETMPLASTPVRNSPEEAIPSVEEQGSVGAGTRPADAERQNSSFPESHGKTDFASEAAPAAAQRSEPAATVPSGIFSWRRRSRARTLEDQLVLEWQNRTTQLLESFAEDARRQLDRLSDWWVVSFQSRMEHAIDASVRNVTAELTRSLQEQIRASGLVALREPISSGPGSTGRGASACDGQETKEVGLPLVEASEQERLLKTFTRVIEDLQAKSAALLNQVAMQLPSVTRASDNTAGRAEEDRPIDTQQPGPGLEGIVARSPTSQQSVMKIAHASDADALVWNPFQS